MKFKNHLNPAAVLLPSIASAMWIPFTNDNFGLLRRGSGCSGCEFTISSTGSFACPVGELPDGQIRANGTENTSTFCINGGSITDSMGFGCIVTPPPTTQVQCDSGATPDPNFSIDSGGNLLYKGSAQFYACPATDTEYNIYINPEFGQTKCFAITLQASGCAAAPPTSTCPPVSTETVWQTQTVSQTVGITVTVMATATETCPAIGTPTPTMIVPPPITTSPPTSTPWLNTTCHHCTETALSSEATGWIGTLR